MKRECLDNTCACAAIQRTFEVCTGDYLCMCRHCTRRPLLGRNPRPREEVCDDTRCCTCFYCTPPRINPRTDFCAACIHHLHEARGPWIDTSREPRWTA